MNFHVLLPAKEWMTKALVDLMELDISIMEKTLEELRGSKVNLIIYNFVKYDKENNLIIYNTHNSFNNQLSTIDKSTIYIICDKNLYIDESILGDISVDREYPELPDTNVNLHFSYIIKNVVSARTCLECVGIIKRDGLIIEDPNKPTEPSLNNKSKYPTLNYPIKNWIYKKSDIIGENKISNPSIVNLIRLLYTKKSLSSKPNKQKYLDAILPIYNFGHTSLKDFIAKLAKITETDINIDRTLEAITHISEFIPNDQEETNLGEILLLFFAFSSLLEQLKVNTDKTPIIPLKDKSTYNTMKYSSWIYVKQSNTINTFAIDYGKELYLVIKSLSDLQSAIEYIESSTNINIKDKLLIIVPCNNN